MLRKTWIIGISAAMAVCVLGATAGFSEDTPPPRLRGTIDQVNGNTLTIKTRSGTPTTVQLKDGSPVIATVKGSMSDIQDDSICRHYRNGAAGRHDQGCGSACLRGATAGDRRGALCLGPDAEYYHDQCGGGTAGQEQTRTPSC